MDFFYDLCINALKDQTFNGGAEIKNILICVQKMKKVLRVWNNMRLSNSFLDEVSL